MLECVKQLISFLPVSDTKMQKPKRFLLLYGSVTGKAQSIAELIAEEGAKKGLDVDLQCLEGAGKTVTLLNTSNICLILINVVFSLTSSMSAWWCW